MKTQPSPLSHARSGPNAWPRLLPGGLARAVMLGSLVVGVSATARVAAAAESSIVNPLVEHRIAPVGVDSAKPRFSWQLKGSTNGLRQTAYQIQVALAAADLTTPGKPLVWDSGWVDSDQSHLVAYAGAALRSSTPYFWQVRIKDQDQQVAAWCPVARWVTGVLTPEKEFRADWIGYDQADADQPHGDDWFAIPQADWICHPGQKSGKEAVVFYRTTFPAPANAKRVMVGMAANWCGQLFLNGVELFQGGKVSVPRYFDVTPWIRPGANRLAIRINAIDKREIPGLIVAVRVEQADGTVTRRFSDATWETTLKPVNLWAGGEKPDDGWRLVKVLGKPGAPNTSGQGDAKLATPRFEDKTFLPPPVYLRTEVNLTKPVLFAVFHGAAQGLYDLHLNGRRLTPTGLQPGWTQFEKHTDYVSTEVTDALLPGRNALGIVLADGWFRGNVLWFGRERFGDKLRIAGELEVEYTDGSRATFRTDANWKAAYGPTRQADIYMGEVYDARREQAGWDRAGFNDASWSRVVAGKPALEGFTLRAHPTEPVRVDMELPPKAITQPQPGVYLMDFGQNLVGWARLKVAGRAGQTIYIRFGEDVNPDGTVYTDNLRSVNPADRYICKGGGVETWEPRFTYHGFRYAQITGLTEKPTPETLTAIVAHSGGPITSTFSSSSAMLNRLYQNVQWSQRGNYFETMTDCPQRDERYGWVGDAHFFMASSAYNQQGASFFTKWFLDCVDTQNPKTGNISNGAPGNKTGAGNAQLDWSAAMMITPWTIWQYYGDTRPMRENYPALRLYMTQWEKFAKQVDAYEKTKKGPAPYKIIGDWVSLEKGTSKEFVGRVLGYLLSRQMAGFARLVDQKADVLTFTELAAHFREQIIQKHIAADGTVTGDTETAYAYVARYGLYEPAQEKLIRAKFEQRLQADKHAVLTGFHGAGNLLQGLTAIGLAADAGKTILNETPPSWGGMVKLGATTIWERWEGKNADGSFYSPWMNSFNHYTFGGCGEWLMGYLVGLRPETPGFKTVRVEPVVIAGINLASGSIESPYGSISNRWERKNGRITMQVILPPNSDARVILPASAKAATLQGKPVTTGQAITIASGKYDFTWSE